VNWEEALPYIVLGGIVLAVILATRPAPPLVVGGPSQPSPEEEQARLETATRLAEIAVQRDIARHQVAVQQEIARYQIEATLRQYEAEKFLRERELEAEKRRAELEASVAKKAADTQFWGSFWGGLFGVIGTGLALLIGLSDPVLYDRAFYRPDRGGSGQLLALRRG
jgi:hypothetical protein